MSHNRRYICLQNLLTRSVHSLCRVLTRLEYHYSQLNISTQRIFYPLKETEERNQKEKKNRCNPKEGETKLALIEDGH